MTIAARLERSSEDRRSRPRHKLRLGASVQSIGENVSIHDISSTGMLIETSVELAPFDALQIELPENGPTDALVMWSSGRFYGCEFTKPLSQATISAVFLRSGPAESRDEQSPGSVAAADSLYPGSVEETVTEENGAQDKWPLPARVATIAASAVVLWAATIWAVVWLVRVVGKMFG